MIARMKSGQKSRPQKWRHHPFAEWFSKPIFNLRKGRDYACNTSSMAQLLHAYARRQRETGVGVWVEVETDPDEQGLTVTIKDKKPTKIGDTLFE
jgi:hypothetical protein